MGRKRLDRATLEGRRHLAMRLLHRGMSGAEAARRLSVSRQAVSKWKRATEDLGSSSLNSKDRPGRPRLLDLEMLAAALETVELAADETGLSLSGLTAPVLVDFVDELFG